MVALKFWGYLGIFLLLCSQWLHIFAAEDQQNQNQPSKIPEPDVLKPPWGSWTFPAPKPEEKKGHREGGRHSSECICNCNCNCEKTVCKEEGRKKGGGPVVCMPMECDHLGCKFEGGMNVEASSNFQIPYFTVAGGGPQGRTKSSGNLKYSEQFQSSNLLTSNCSVAMIQKHLKYCGDSTFQVMKNF